MDSLICHRCTYSRCRASAAPLCFAGSCEITTRVLLVMRFRFELEQRKPCRCYHSALLLLRHLLPYLGLALSGTAEIRRQRLVIMVKKFCQLFGGDFLDRHVLLPFSKIDRLFVPLN